MAKKIPDNWMYQFDLTTVNAEQFAPFLSTLFRDDEWQKMLAKRNHLAKTVIDQQFRNITVVKTLEEVEQRMALGLMQGLFDFSKHLKGQECMMAADLMKSSEMTPEKQEHLKKALNYVDSLTFLNDIMLGQLNDALSEMKQVDEEFTIPELDGVKFALANLHAWGKKRRKNDTPEETELFNEYADSIEQYLNGRVKTFVEKYRKLENSNL